MDGAWECNPAFNLTSLQKNTTQIEWYFLCSNVL